jgi:hypothetical protein
MLLLPTLLAFPGALAFPDPEDQEAPSSWFVEPTRVLKVFPGEAPGGQFGWEAADVGDLDGDGIHDVVTSAPFLQVEGVPRGRVYVYSGATGKALFQKTGAPREQLGLSVSGAGDVDADGTADVCVGGPGARGGAGAAYVLSGADGKVLLEIRGDAAGDQLGAEVAPAGDFDGDGHADLLVSAPRCDAGGADAGRVLVCSGADGSRLVTLDGESAGDQFGTTISADRFEDELFLVVGAMNAGAASRGRVYVYWGEELELLHEVEADARNVNLGRFFSSVIGDANGDGEADFYFVDFESGADVAASGRAYVLSGSDGRLLHTFTGRAGEGLGIGDARAGDVDGDGCADLIVGAWQNAEGAPGAGKAYLYSGKDGKLLRSYTCKVAGDTFGFDATGIGDVDGDGGLDFLFTSAWSNEGGPRTGRALILAGPTPAELADR